MRKRLPATHGDDSRFTAANLILGFSLFLCLVLLLVLLIPRIGDGRKSEASAKRTNDGAAPSDTGGASVVRNAIPAVEAYYADHSAYEGMTMAELRKIDAGIGGITVTYADADSYCIASTGEPTYYKEGPAREITTTPCGKDNSPTTKAAERRMKAAAHAVSIVRSDLPAIQVYYRNHANGYEGMTAAALRKIDAEIGDITVAYADGGGYCIESTGNPIAHLDGPDGSSALGPCPTMMVISP